MLKPFFHDSPVTHSANQIFVYKLHSYLNHSIETNVQIVKRIVLRYVDTNTLIEMRPDLYLQIKPNHLKMLKGS